jgi:hypothetical protein
MSAISWRVETGDSKMPGKLNMVKNKQGKMVPDYAADGVGKMMRGGRVGMMRGGEVKMMRGGKVNGYANGGCVMTKTNQNPIIT